MECQNPECRYANTGVTCTITRLEAVIRYRKCFKCGKSFKTTETPENLDMLPAAPELKQELTPAHS